MFRKYLALLAATLALACHGAHAADFPDRPLRLIAPIPPGGSGDMIARLVATAAAQALGQSIVVENRPGATGNIGTALAARAQADGYTLLLCSFGNCAVNPSLYRDTGYDLFKDFRPVVLIASSVNVLTVGRHTGIASLKELVARAKGGELSYASSGIGASNHLAGEMLKKQAGIDLLHVPYKGSGPAINDLLGGQVDVFFDNEPSILPFVQSGKVTAVAVTGRTRSSNLPDVPTLRESGYADFIVEPWYGIAVPRATPDAVVAKLVQAFDTGLRQEKTRAALQAAGFATLGGSPEAMQELMRQEHDRWAALIKAQGISAH